MKTLAKFVDTFIALLILLLTLILINMNNTYTNAVPSGQAIKTACQTYGPDAVTALLAGGFEFEFDFCEATGGRVLSVQSVQNFENLLKTK